MVIDDSPSIIVAYVMTCDFATLPLRQRWVELQVLQTRQWHRDHRAAASQLRARRQLHPDTGAGPAEGGDPAAEAKI